MSKYTREQLQQIKSFSALVKYLHDELEWPVNKDSFDDLTFDYEPEELGIDSKTAAKIKQIKQLRPLDTKQPWGIFFVEFEPKRLPVVVLRRILSQLVIKKRISRSEQASWNLHDLLFISNYGEGEGRQITFAQFAIDENTGGSPVLRVLGWDDADTALHIDHVHTTLKEKLLWPADTSDFEGWRNNWSAAFTLRHKEVITTSKELAESLAELAIRIRKRANKVMDIETDKGALRKLYKAFQQALIHDLSEDDFADMYAQTITYGLLAARVSRPMGIISENLSDMVPITNPFLKDMLNTFLNVGGRKHKIDFDELGIQEVVELLNNPATHIEAILRDFGNKTRQEDPVIHFYEFFLTAYDKKKKVERGVFYTPQPVVSFIVRGVHELLQTEFGLEDGLADITTWGEMHKRNKQIIIPQGVQPDEPFVLILDIATGTATFLVEVIDVIYKTMYNKWEEQGKNEKQIAIAWNEYVPKHLLPRLYGFELMMAPYAIAHMKIGLKLAETGYRFGSTERVHVYLTNTLEPHSEVAQLSLFSEALAKEANAVNYIKKNKYFTVVLGNPPYSVSSYNKSHFIEGIMGLYKVDVKDEKNIQLLSDDYSKFIRFCHWKIEQTGLGVLGLITKNTYLNTSAFKGLRKKLVEGFDKVFILNLHGKLYEKTPENGKDQNVFDIRVGTSILFSSSFNVKQKHELGKLYFKELQGERTYKYDFLANNNFSMLNWEELKINTQYYFFEKKNFSEAELYDSFFKVDEIFNDFISGVQTGKDHFVIGDDEKELSNKLNAFIESTLPRDLIEKTFQLKDQAKFNISKIKKTFKSIDKNKLESYSFKPFYIRKIYYDTFFLRRDSYSVMKNLKEANNNIALIIKKSSTEISYNSVLCSKYITDLNFLGGQSFVFPLWIYLDSGVLFGTNKKSNIRQGFELEVERQYMKEDITEQIFYYIYAILYCPKYRETFAKQLQMDYPKIPFTSDYQTFKTVSDLGNSLVDLHLLKSKELHFPVIEFKGNGNNIVSSVELKENNLLINNTQYFHGITNEIWAWEVGKNKPVQRFIKNNKNKELKQNEITEFCKICTAIYLTFQKQNEIDEEYETIIGSIIEK
jgi:predicted helicase